MTIGKYQVIEPGKLSNFRRSPSLMRGLSIEWLDMFSGWIVGDHRLGASLNKEGAQGIAVIGGAGGAEAAGRQACQ